MALLPMQLTSETSNLILTDFEGIRQRMWFPIRESWRCGLPLCRDAESPLSSTASVKLHENPHSHPITSVCRRTVCG